MFFFLNLSFDYGQMLGLHKTLSDEERVKLVGTLITEYQAAINVGTPREPSERIVGDDLILLAVRIINNNHNI